MHASGSVIATVVEKFRLITDEPVSKFTDDILVRQYLGSAWAETMSMLKMTSDSLPIVMLTLSIAAETGRYVLPSWMDSIIRLVRRSTSPDAAVEADYVPRNLYSQWGPGWRIEGNEVVFDPVPQEEDTLELWVVPSGDVCLHVGTGVVTSTTQIKLAATPSMGLLDRRINAYAGCMLRIITTGRSWQERVISAYDPDTRTATVHTAFLQNATNLPADSASVVYEIAPLGQRSMMDAMAWKVAMMVGASRDISMKRMQFLEHGYQRGLKSVFDRAKVQRRIGLYTERNTIDNQQLASIDVWAFER